MFVIEFKLSIVGSINN